MKTYALIAVSLVFATITWLQLDLIISALLSLASWCVLVVSSPGSFKAHWYPGLVEYWLAGVVWISTAVLLVRRIQFAFRPLLNRERRMNTRSLLRVFTGQHSSLRTLGLITYVAMTTPFLVPIDPNAQGNLVTTRLLPPLSGGYVRIHVEDGDGADKTTGFEHVFRETRRYLLNRMVILNRDASSHAIDPSGKSDVVKRFRTVFLFGTDDNARDVFSRVVAGTRISLGIGLCAALGALLLGGSIGFVVGMIGGVVDAILMRLTDLFLAIPSLLLVIGVLAFVGESIVAIVLVLAFSGWMGIARVVRGEILSLREREFILAAKLLGISRVKIAVRHLIPNIRPVLFTSLVLQFANAALGEAALGFLGLGIQPPTPSWGNMMGEAVGYLGAAWWVGVFPGILLAVVIVSFHSLCERRSGDDFLKESDHAT